MHPLPARGANVYALLKREKVVLTVAAVQQLEQRLLSPIRRRPWDAHPADFVSHNKKHIGK